MKIAKTFLLAGIFFATTLIAQSKYYEKTYSWTQNHTGMTITTMDNDNYLISCGFFVTGNDTNSSALLSITPAGELNFLEPYIEEDYENIVREVIKNDNGYLLAGWSRAFSPEEQMFLYILQTDFEGNKLSSTTLSPDDYECGAYTGFRTSDGGYMLGGLIIPYTSSPFFHEPYLIKLNTFGQKQWSQIYDNYGANNWVQDMLPADDGGAYLLLQTNYWAGGSDMALLKIDSLGGIVWEKNYDFNPYPDILDATDQHDYPRSIIRTLDGGFLITAMIDTIVYEIPEFEFFFFDGFGAVIKTDSLGNIKWMNFEHSGENQLSSISCALPDSSYVICGSRLFATEEGPWADQLDVELFKLDVQGNTLWTRYYGGEFNDYAFDMIPDADGGFVLCGRKEFIDYAADTGMAYVYVIKTNCMGLLTQPAAAFTYEPQGANEVQFTNLSLYAYPDSIDGGYYIWNFGDGSPPYLCGQGYAPCTGNMLTHQYPAPGSYTATLTAIVCTDTSMVQAVINTEGAGGTVGIAENSPPVEGLGVVGVIVYPNPAQNTLFLANWQNMANFKLYAISGVPMLGYSPVSSLQIGIGQLPAGLYIAEAQYKNGAIQRQKLLIQR